MLLCLLLHGVCGSVRGVLVRGALVSRVLYLITVDRKNTGDDRLADLSCLARGCAAHVGSGADSQAARAGVNLRRSVVVHRVLLWLA